MTASRGSDATRATGAVGATGAWILAIDTGTSRIVVAAGTPAGATLATRGRPAGFRHGELLLAEIDRMITDAGLRRDALAGIVVGTGPGAFTGLRVGLSTAKTMAHALGVSIVGVSTAAALLRAGMSASGRATRERAASGGRDDGDILLLPAGPRERSIVRDGSVRLLVDQGEVDGAAPDRLIAVDLEGRAPDHAVARGRVALDGLGSALIEIGAARLAVGDVDDAAELVPDYVTLPRGVLATTGAIEWSSDGR